MPASFSTFGTAAVGPIPMISGATPPTAKCENRASGFKPSWAAFCADMMMTAAAPSDICEELPAVTVPPGRKTGFRRPSASMLVSGRGPSSRVKVNLRMVCFPPGAGSTISTSIGTSSGSKRPEETASAARMLERRANSSWSSRVIPYFSATFSAVSPMLVNARGISTASTGSGANLNPVIGTIDMDSSPPAMAISICPDIMANAAWAMDCTPEEQNRLMVSAGTVSGSPAPSETRRATFMPCSPSGKAHPMMTSSTSAGSTAGARASNSFTTATASASERTVARLPRFALPTGVRAAATITASRIVIFLLLFIQSGRR